MSAQVRDRVSNVPVRKPHVAARRFQIRPIEIVVATLVLLSFIGAVFYYFWYLKPEQENLTRLQAQLASQRDDLFKMATPEDPKLVQNEIKQALETLDTFKGSYLKPRSRGQRELIDEINALVKKHNSRLASGLEMSVENIGGESDKEKARNKKAEENLEVFPKLNVSFTIAGEYKNLRAFISELESSKQFLVIRQLTFSMEEGLDGDTGRRTQAANSLLSLSVVLSAHFQS